MSEINDGGPAFPQHSETGNLEDWRHGMTLRDYFAGQALAGMCAGLTRFRTDEGMEDIIVHRPADVSEIAFVYADAMLKGREAKP